MSIAEGTRLGPYEVTTLIGAGGMGEVYRARDTRLERDVAVKLLTSADADASTRLLREARSASALNHPNICTLHEIGDVDGRPFIVMEFVAGEPLDQKIARGPLPMTDVLRGGIQIAEGLGHAHGRGVVHRDLKSANVVITPDGRAKILDFGIARRTAPADVVHATQSLETLTASPDIAGTLPYMAPESLEGRPADARTDLWALGVILVEMSTGQRPFRGHTGLALTTAILRDDPDIPAGMPPTLAPIVRKLLAKLPSERFQTAGETAAALQALASATHSDAASRRRRPLAIAVLGSLVLAAAAMWALMAGTGPVADELPAIRSIAILPLENQSGDEQQQYFADGMTEALISQLAAIDALHVISRTSVMQFKGTSQPPADIARTLNVDGIVEGAVARDEQNVRITARLIDARSGRLIWSGEYEKPVTGALTLQREVAARIGREIQGELTPADAERLGGEANVDPAAFQSYLRGRFHWNLRTYSDLQRAKGFFEAAIAAAPEFALAHAGLADVYVLLGDYRDMLPAEAYRRARVAVDTALRLDPALAEAHTTRAWLAFAADRDWKAAEQAFATALELNPGYATAHQWNGEFLLALGRFDDAFASLRKAQQLDPLALMPQAIHGWAAYLAGRYAEALALCEAALSRDPSFRPARMYRAWTYIDQNRMDEALAEIDVLLRTSSSTAVPIATRGRIHARRGERARALETIEQLKALDYPPSFDIAKVYAELRDRAPTLAWLRKAEAEQNSAVLYVQVDRTFEWLQEDAQFIALLDHLNLR